jgi:hypothetical protein
MAKGDRWRLAVVLPLPTVVSVVAHWSWAALALWAPNMMGEEAKQRGDDTELTYAVGALGKVACNTLCYENPN